MKNIFKYIAVFLLLVLVKTGMAQTLNTDYNIYTQNRFLYSPAYSGDYGQVFVDGKQQWSGIAQSNETFTFGMHNAIGNAKKSGIGLLLSVNKLGVQQYTKANFNYSYKVNLAARSDLAFGIAAGVHNLQYRTSDFVASDIDEVKRIAGDNEITRLDMRFGFKYNWDKRLEIGASLPSIFDNEYGFNKYFNGIISYNLYAAKERLEIQPSVMVQSHITDNNSTQLDLNLYSCWDQTVWVQGAYRMNPNYDASALIVSAGVNLYNVGIGYAYQHDMGDVTRFGNGTHEIQLTYYFDKERRQNRNADLLNNNQIEMFDSTEQDLGQVYQNQIDSLRDEIEKMNQAMKLKDVSEFADELLKRLEALDQAFLQKAKEAPDMVAVFFDTNKYNVKPEYQAQLDAYADKLKEKGASVTVSGYADEQGPNNYNQTLSEKRAEAVKEYLVRQGVSAGKITTVGKGETTNFGQSLDSNRRAECK